MSTPRFGLFRPVSPDGLSLDRGDSLYSTEAAAVAAITAFCARFKMQGYYRDSRLERIELDELPDRCGIEEVDETDGPARIPIDVEQAIRREWNHPDTTDIIGCYYADAYDNLPLIMAVFISDGPPITQAFRINTDGKIVPLST